MSFFKALLPGSILTWLVCIIMGSNGSRGAWLNIHHVSIQSVDFYWSWPLFIAATGLAWGIFWMME
ncbi:MAG: hypothetical protein KDE32_06485 [Novosphingobium sp.]|nr:hypothetical protein [Novosphingobium sp.]